MQTALISLPCVASQGVYHEAIFHLYQVQLVWTELPGGSLNFQSGFCFGGYSSAQARLHHCVYLNRKIRAWEDQSPEQRSCVCWAKTDWDTSRGPGLTFSPCRVMWSEITFHPLALDYAGCVHCVFQTCLSESYKNKGGVLVVNAFTFTHCALQPSLGYFNF